MTILAAILVTLVAGVPLTLLIDRRANGAALVGLSFFYGTALVHFVLLGFAFAGVRWSAVNTTAALLAIAAVAFVIVRKRSPQPPSILPPIRFHPLDGLTLLLTAGYAISATIAPVWEWDFWAIWGLKARVFAEAATIDWRFLESPWNDFAHPDYPLLLPLNYAYASLMNGGWSDRWLGFYGVAFGLALLLVVRQFAGEELRPVVAAAVTAALTLFALSRFVGLAEAPLIAFSTSSLLFLRKHLRTGDHAAGLHGALLLGCAALTKNEGLALIASIAIGCLAVSWRSAVRLWPAVALVTPWTIARSVHLLPGDLLDGSIAAHAAARLRDPLTFARLLLDQLPDVTIWVLLLFAVVFIVPGVIRRERFVFVAFAAQLLACVGIYLITPRDLEWHVQTSWFRVAHQLPAALLFVVMVALAEMFTRGDDSLHAEARSEF